MISLIKFFQPRYSIYTSADALSWAWAVNWLFKKDAIQSANTIAAQCPYVFVQVNDLWRNSKMVHFVKADLNAMKERADRRWAGISIAEEGDQCCNK